MQLLDSCPLPQAQFASLSILLQLHLPNDDENEDSNTDPYYPNIIKNVSSEDIESTNNNHEVKMVQCKTSTGTTKTVPLYPKGMKIYYKNTFANTKLSSTIVDVHMDDLLEPYYTIRFNDDDGNWKEKQTDNAHIRLDNVPTEEEEETDNVGGDDDGNTNDKDEEVDADAYSLGPSISSDDDDYNSSSHNDNKNNNGEADKSAGPPSPPQRRKLRHAILKESLTVISPLTLLPEKACKRSLDSLHRRLMEEFDMRDDFTRINSNDDDGDGDVNKENKLEGDNNNNNNDDNDDDDNGDGSKLRREKSRVRFQEDTKKGATTQVVDPSTIASSGAKKGEDPTAPFGSMLPVKIYQPPKHHLNCSLGLTMFYVAVYVEDVSSSSSQISISSLQETNEREENKEKDSSMGAFYNCASVLLPGMSLSELTNSIGGLLELGSSGSGSGGSSNKQHDKKQKKCGGVILLTIGATGPAYDLYGASYVIATLTERLREGMSTLARMDTTPKEVVVAAASLTNQSQQKQQQGGSPRKKKSKGKNGTPTASSSAAKALEQQTTQQQQPQKRIISYDATYFKRIYMALLATLIDDEDGLMRDHDRDDEIIPPTVMSDSYHPPIIGSRSGEQQQQQQQLFSSTAAVVGSYVPSQMQRPPPSLIQSTTESTTGLLASQNVTSSGTLKKKRFTFSRKKSSKPKISEMAYESGEMISGGEQSNVVAGGGGAGSDGGEGADNAEIVRRTAQQLEVLSLVEDDMDLPKYSHADNSKVSSRGGGTKRSLESPRRTKPGGGHHYHAGISSGRFGRQPVPSDLAGFEYRAPSSSHSQHFQHGAGMSSAGTANTSLTGASSADDGSVQTGDDSATIATGGSKYTIGSGSQSSNVPTLSKSKRDTSKTTTGTSRLRFLRRKKKENKSIAGMTSAAAKSGSLKAKSEEAFATSQHQQKAAKIKKKPPLFPQHQQSLPPLPQHQVYDPFSMEEEAEEEEDNHGQQEHVKTFDDQSSVGTQSVGSMYATKEDTVETPGSLKAGISEPQAPPVTSEEGSSTPVFSTQQERTGPPQDNLSNIIRRSFSEDSEGVRTEHSQQSQSAASIGTESAASIMTEQEEAFVQPNEPTVTEEVNAVEPTRYLDVELALNEDLTCEYKRSKLSSLTVEGTVQVRVKSRYEEEPPPEHRQSSTIPFFLVFQDHSGHIKALQENKKFVENVTHEQRNAIANREFTYTVKVPREEEYFPVVRYKCGNSLRPVPIRVQSRVRTQGKHARIALQISSNPQNPSDLVHLTIIMSVPEGVRGDSLQCNPPGGVWNESKRVVLWCVSELGGGEKFQLQSIFDIEEELLNSSESEEDLAEKLEFPVLSRCQCAGAQLSDVALEVSDVGSDIFPAEVSKTVVQRFRVSHKESNR